MGFEVTWTPQALQSFQDVIDYLTLKWTEREVFKFTASVNRILLAISRHPALFHKSSVHKNIHRAVIVRQVTLVYRVHYHKREIVLLNFWSNRRDPSKDPFK